ncbi:MAG: ATP phosphoribosyltransferase [Gemmatimonadota bacterium]
MLTIALPGKGRMAQETRELFRDAGLDLGAADDRSLIASLANGMRILFVRAQDIPEFVADGAADAGVTGWDLVCESGRDVSCVQDLGFGGCRLVLAARSGSGVRDVADIPPHSRVATVFTRITTRYFAELGIPVEVVPVSGATEAAPHLGIADLIVDIASTGSTLRMNGLAEVSTILDSSARLVATTLLPEELRPALEELDLALKSVLRARTRRYLMANVPRSRLQEVRAVLPGLNGPTVTDIPGSGHVAVHAVVNASSIYTTVSSLRSLGAEGILVTRIERLVP